MESYIIQYYNFIIFKTGDMHTLQDFIWIRIAKYCRNYYSFRIRNRFRSNELTTETIIIIIIEIVLFENRKSIFLQKQKEEMIYNVQSTTYYYRSLSPPLNTTWKSFQTTRAYLNIRKNYITSLGISNLPRLYVMHIFFLKKLKKTSCCIFFLSTIIIITVL